MTLTLTKFSGRNIFIFRRLHFFFTLITSFKAVITGAFPHPSKLPKGRESNHNNKVLLLRHYRHAKNYDHLCPPGAQGQKRRCSSLQLISNTSHNDQINYFLCRPKQRYCKRGYFRRTRLWKFVSTRCVV
jgi:hypothetical protein